MTVMLVYCDDESHTANPVGPYITDLGPAVLGHLGKVIGHSWPVVPDDVYVAGEFSRSGAHWKNFGRKQANRRVGNRRLSRDGQERELLDDGTVLPPRAHRTKAQQMPELFDETREKWSPRCRRCDQRGGRWKAEDRDDVFTQLSERGITGVSLRTLDLIKHGK